MRSVPEIVAIDAARSASDRAWALAALADYRSIRERLLLALAIFVCGASSSFVTSFGISAERAFAVSLFSFIALIALLLGVEVYHLRRRVKALTHLVLRRERNAVEP